MTRIFSGYHGLSHTSMNSSVVGGVGFCLCERFDSEPNILVITAIVILKNLPTTHSRPSSGQGNIWDTTGLPRSGVGVR